jgi:outer membrane protein OmpA-like peptidoglycan-associated protein
MSLLRSLSVCLVCQLPVSANALDLQLPSNAKLLFQEGKAADSTEIAIGPFANGDLPELEAEGEILRQAWSLQSNATTLQTMQPLRDQLAAQDYQTLYSCFDSECGGFDFRFELDVFPAPYMHVNLFDFRYLTVRRGTPKGQSYVEVLVSKAGGTSFIQLTQIAPQESGYLQIKTTGTTAVAPASPRDTHANQDQPLPVALETAGHVILADLAFETGSSTLGPGPFATLAALADFLRADPARRVALVGHTDSEGSLDGNIALSKRRAASVLERLVSAHSVPRAQLAAEGMGYLSPISSNLTPEGRDRNRRVEVILLNTQ